MKKLYLLFMFSNFVSSYAQNFEWAKDEGKYAYDYGYGIINDAAGNVYVAGKYEENAIFSGTTLPCQGNHDIYLAKYSASGNLTWVRTGGGYDGDYAHAIAYNQANTIYIAGEVEGGTALVSFPGSTITLTPAGDNDVFIAAYDLNGNLEWAKSEGHWYNEKALGIACDNSSNVVICGYYRDTTKFGNTFIASKGSKDMFVAKYTSTGNLLWMKHGGGPGEEEANSVICDASGNIYVCGMYADGAIFGSATYTTVNTQFGHFPNGYLAKYDPNGNLLWFKVIGGDWTDVAWSLTKDNGGKIYVAGEFSGVKFDNVNDVWPVGKEDAFVACYDQNGNFQWVNHGGGPIADRARGVGCDGTTIYMTGQFGLNSTFGPNSVTAADSSDIFISALDNMGNFLWTKTVGGVSDTFELDGFESGIAICARPGMSYVTGALLDGGTFDGISLNSYKRTDIFIAKTSTTVSITEEAQIDDDFKLYPNPAKETITITFNQDFGNAELVIYDLLGQTSLNEKLKRHSIVNLHQLKPGLYFYNVLSNNEKMESGKLVIE
jgi:hypothetical protein